MATPEIHLESRENVTMFALELAHAHIRELRRQADAHRRTHPAADRRARRLGRTR
jgi:hypothetical protein